MQQLLSFIEAIQPGFSKSIIPSPLEINEELNSICIEINNKPLPKFYREFLNTMGESMGELSPRKFDFSAKTILSKYSEEKFYRAKGYFLVGYVDKAVDDLHNYYDLSESNDDAKIVTFSGRENEEPQEVVTNSFKDRLAHMAFIKFCIAKCSIRKEGFLSSHEKKDNANILKSVLKSKGFFHHQITSNLILLFSKDNIHIALYCSPSDDPNEGMVYDIAGPSEEETKKVQDLLKAHDFTFTELNF